MTNLSTVFLVLSLFLAPALTFGGTTSKNKFPLASQISSKNLIGTLKNPDVVDGCGCSFQLPAERAKPDSKKFIFLSDIDGKNVYMNIAGKDIVLKRLGGGEFPEAKKRSRFTERYFGDNTNVQVDYLTTWVCPPKDESCEVTRFDGSITAQQGTQKEVLKVKGDCGC